jgi:hypothetical protein
MCDFKGFTVEKNVFKPRKKVTELTKKVVLVEADVDGVEELIKSHKEELSTEDSVQLEKKHQEEEEDEKEEKEDRTENAEVLRTLRSRRLAEAFRLDEEGSCILDDDNPDSKERK